MRTILFILLLIPPFVSADTLPTKYLEPVIRVSNDTIYVTDKKGNDWAVITECEINADEIKEFTVRGKVIKSGKVIKFSRDKHCEIESVSSVT